MKTARFLTILACFQCLPALAGTLRINPVDNENSRYCSSLLLRALEYTGENYSFEASTGVGSQAREIQDLADNKIDIIWIATSKDLEEQLMPIRVPLYRGLLGYRIFIIEGDNQARFDGVNSFADVQQIRVGQGRTWSDTFILEANGIEVVKTAKYVGLFHMVEGGRFDAFARGVHEPWSEIRTHSELNLAVEKNLALIYRMPMYFFVNKENKALAEKVESGLLRMIEDGSFDEFFFNDPMIKDTLEQSNLANRKFFHIDNPFLPEKTPVDNPKLWLDISNLNQQQ
jgi:hypothetical protein